MPTTTFWNLPEAKRQNLIEIALEEFATHTYEEASISRIVAQAGIAKGSLYQYFENKQALYSYLLELTLAKKREFLAQQPPPDPSQGLFAYLRWLFRQSSAFEICYPRFSRLGYLAAYGNTPLPPSLMAQATQGTEIYFQELVRLGMAQGEIDPTLDPAVAAFVFTAIFQHLGRFLLTTSGVDAETLSQEGHFPHEAPAVQATFDQLMRLLQHGMGAAHTSDGGQA